MGQQLRDARHCAGDLGQERTAVDRLRQKCDGSLVRGPCASLGITMRCEDDDRNAATVIGQAALETQSVHARHAKVKDQAGQRLQVRRAEQRLGRRERDDSESRRPQQAVEREADTLIVVDDPDDVDCDFHDTKVTAAEGGRGPIRWYKLTTARGSATTQDAGSAVVFKLRHYRLGPSLDLPRTPYDNPPAAKRFVPSEIAAATLERDGLL